MKEKKFTEATYSTEDLVNRIQEEILRIQNIECEGVFSSPRLDMIWNAWKLFALTCLTRFIDSMSIGCGKKETVEKTITANKETIGHNAPPEMAWCEFNNLMHFLTQIHTTE